MRNGRGPLLAFTAAALFGGATVGAKALLGDVSPFMLAGLLYLGSGTGLGMLLLGGVVSGRRRGNGSPLTRRDLPWLAGAILSGGVLAPLLLMWGLLRTPASTASLLLNLEGVLTALLAWSMFRENMGVRSTLGLVAITVGAVLLSVAPAGGGDAGVPGRIAIVAACLAWALDNNLTRRISAADPLVIAGAKGLAAGLINTGIALALGRHLPGASLAVLSCLVGFVGYGASLVLFVMALREMGAARTGALFSTAPFVGAICSLLFLGETAGPLLLPAALLMGTGVWLQLRERHSHEHVHEAVIHHHSHRHDDHHRHAHDGSEPSGEGHSHPHAHPFAKHSHEHFPDTHHDHSHR